MRTRHADGSWFGPFEPVATDDRQSPGFIEGNAAQYSFHVPHNMPGLIALMGGPGVRVLPQLRDSQRADFR
jgi:putative alpha-1,2-mannosidase